MKTIKILSALILAVILTSCEEEEELFNGCGCEIFTYKREVQWRIYSIEDTTICEEGYLEATPSIARIVICPAEDE